MAVGTLTGGGLTTFGRAIATDVERAVAIEAFVHATPGTFVTGAETVLKLVAILPTWVGTPEKGLILILFQRRIGALILVMTSLAASITSTSAVARCANGTTVPMSRMLIIAKTHLDSWKMQL